MKRVVSLFLLAVLLAVSGFLLAPSAFPTVFAQRDRDPAAVERDAWQRPEEVMDALGLRASSAVADVGCGEGYFVLRLARRVGAEGTVYAVDIDEGVLRKLRRRIETDGLTNVRVIIGKRDDPLLPEDTLDAVLIVNAYHEMREYDAMLRAIYAALKPGGRLAIIEPVGEEDADRATHFARHTISEKLVQQDAARNGFRFRSKEPGFERPNSPRRHWFFLLFEKPQTSPDVGQAGGTGLRSVLCGGTGSTAGAPRRPFALVGAPATAGCARLLLLFDKPES